MISTWLDNVNKQAPTAEPTSRRVTLLAQGETLAPAVTSFHRKPCGL
jgi:hypothetical protein